MVYLVLGITEGLPSFDRNLARGAWLLWVLVVSRAIKYIEHFARYPEDLIYVPLLPLFGYLHSICIKTYAMFTLYEVRTHPFPVLKQDILIRYEMPSISHASDSIQVVLTDKTAY